ncbi:MAG: zf-HC2 domain-containing protein [Lachnospiraceae bacterium]|nr:zf-HC2 domain-containing protein [Lachnospiraceae bacterium]
MMNNEKCCLIKDLLPSYIDELCSEETNAIVKEHLDGCENCRRIYTAMTSDVSGNPAVSDAADQQAPPIDKASDAVAYKKDTGTSDEYDRMLLQRVSRDVKRKTNRSVIVTIVALALAFFIVFGFTAPVVPVKSSDLYADVTKVGYTATNVTYKYNQLPYEKTLLFPKGDKNLDECYFQYLNLDFKNNDSELYKDIKIAIDMEYMKDIQETGKLPFDIQMIELYCNKPIKSYDSEIINGKFVIKNVRTTIFGSLSNEAQSHVTLINTDNVSSIVICNGFGNKDQITVWGKFSD